MPRLLLVRHAQSQNNANHERLRVELAGQPQRILEERERVRVPDPDLTAIGEEQAARLGEALSTVAAREDTALITSPMRRALQTATQVAARAGLKPERVIVDGTIYEAGGSFYLGEARPSTTPAQIEAEFPVRCRGLNPAGWFADRTRRETDEELDARVGQIIAWVEAELARGVYRTLIVVCHGELLSLWLRRWLGVSPTRALAFVHANAGVTTLDWRRGEGVLLRRLNAVEHLPERLRTGQSANWWRYARPYS